ncbi:MAG: Asp-tRNA(Asn)/Glu-tRNA(Gln) amidotransferase subunit GatA [Holosporales bacterium]|jgi:aspartyl-tRNA(Asn)/glutamyl-tRNA(Gln) amidotransferase subunit A|nr:Asp-tRNA(Asn)/Glu-tRNA(Gln) amidotransferase subunit GatA [Holosporales bacterium]
MGDLCGLTLVQATDKLRRGEISSVELTEAFIKKIEGNRKLNAFITETFDVALRQAKQSDAKLCAARASSKNSAASSSSTSVGKLEGAPLGIKDLFCTKGIRTTAGSKILENFVPPYESTVTQNLLDEGAVFLGKTNMDEFAMGSSNITSYYGNVISPIRSTKFPEKDLVPGGSSGGSSAAVAAHMVLAATASDTGGSIRQPASFTGTVGIKPTYGLCSRYGMMALASSLDQAGPIARDVRDAALMLSVMASFDPKDSTSVPRPRTDYLADLTPSKTKGLKVGLPIECFENLSEELSNVMQNNIEILKGLGAEFFDVSLKNLKYALPVYYIIQPAEASSNLARYDGVRYGVRAENARDLSEMYTKTRSEGFGREVRRRIFNGTFVLSKGGYDSYYVTAQKVLQCIQNDFCEAFKRVDVLFLPTTTGGAFGIEEGANMSPIDMYLNDIFTVSVNLAGLPGISVNGGFSSDGLPLGVQFVGQKFSEQRLLNIAGTIEEAHAH